MPLNSLNVLLKLILLFICGIVFMQTFYRISDVIFSSTNTHNNNGLYIQAYPQYVTQ